MDIVDNILMNESSYLQVYWSETGEMCAICTEESYFVLKYSQAAVNRCVAL